MKKKYIPRGPEPLTEDEKELLELSSQYADLVQKVDKMKKQINVNLLYIGNPSLDFIQIAKTKYPAIINGRDLIKLAGQPKIDAAMGEHDIECYEKCGKLMKVPWSKKEASYSDICSECGEKREIENKIEREQYRQTAEQERIELQKEVDRLRSLPYKDYLQSEHWKFLRKEKLRKAVWRCELCGEKGWSNLNVHHKHYETVGEEKLTDLIVLCKNCHSKHHDKIERETKFPEMKGITMY